MRIRTWAQLEGTAAVGAIPVNSRQTLRLDANFASQFGPALVARRITSRISAMPPHDELVRTHRPGRFPLPILRLQRFEQFAVSEHRLWHGSKVTSCYGGLHRYASLARTRCRLPAEKVDTRFACSPWRFEPGLGHKGKSCSASSARGPRSGLWEAQLTTRRGQ